MAFASGGLKIEQWPVLCVLLALFHGDGRSGVRADLDLLLLHTNDMHSRFEETAVDGTPCTDGLSKNKLCYGGFARIKQALTESREAAAKENVPSLYLDGGDVFQGTAYFSLLKWPVVAAMIRTLGIDVAALGNHEFDDGVESLSAYLINISVPVVSANLDVTNEPNLINVRNLHRSIILEVGEKKHQVGIVGYTLRRTKKTGMVGKADFLNEIESVRSEAKKLKSQNVNIIIALGHAGFETDVEIAKKISEVSLVVGAHSHSLLYTPKEKPPSIEKVTAEYPHMVHQKSGRQVPVVQAYCNTKYLGKLRVKFNDKGDVIFANGNPILLDASIKQDENALVELTKFKNMIVKATSRVEGITAVYLSRAPYLTMEECNIGNLVTDALVDYATRRYDYSLAGWTDAPVAILDGAVRSEFDNKKNEGRITYGDILTILTYRVPVYKVQLKGSTLEKMLEHSVDKQKNLQFSGMKVVYDLSKSKRSLKSVTIRCKDCSVPQYYPLQHDRIYTVIIREYVLKGGGPFKVVKKEHISATPLNTTESDATAEYIRNLGVVYPGIEGRIIIETGLNYASFASTPNLFLLSSSLWCFILQFWSLA